MEKKNFRASFQKVVACNSAFQILLFFQRYQPYRFGGKKMHEDIIGNIERIIHQLDDLRGHL